jgi:hypothetical protein
LSTASGDELIVAGNVRINFVEVSGAEAMLAPDTRIPEPMEAGSAVWAFLAVEIS